MSLSVALRLGVRDEAWPTIPPERADPPHETKV